MRQLQFLALSILLTLGLGAEQARKWLLTDGTMFSASFISADTSNVQLKAESGKVAPVSMQKLSVADLLYLVDKQGVDQEKLDRFYTRDVERKFRPNRKLMRKGKTIEIQSDERDFKFTTFSSEHFEIWSDERMDFNSIAEILEKAWFYTAWHHPHFRDRFTKKRLLIFTHSDEAAQALCSWYATQHPALPSEHLQRIKDSWPLYEQQWHLDLPEFKERNIDQTVFYWRADMRDNSNPDTEKFRFVVTYMHFYYSYDSSIMRDNEEGMEAMYYFYYSKLMEAEYSFYDEVNFGIGSDTGSTPGQGKIRDFARDLVKGIEKGDRYARLDYLFSIDYALRGDVDFSQQLYSLSHFLHSDMRHELGVARYIAGLNDRTLEHSAESLATCCGYASAEELSTAYRSYLLGGKFR